MPPKSQRADQSSSVKAAADNLKKADWHFPPFKVTDDVEKKYRDYLQDLQRKNHGRDLSPPEEDYVWSRWVRSQAMMRNLDEFNRLIGFCELFVDELTKIGKQSILGTRAALKKALTHERPSPTIEFRPELLPDDPPLSSSEYETLVGGPHVLGARLVWWCAAAKSPQKYGYSPGFSHQIWTQPFWFLEKTEKNLIILKFNQRPMTLIQESVKYCLENEAESELAGSSGLKNPGVDRLTQHGATTAPKNGPGPAGRFYWDGEQIELQPLQAHLMELLWKNEPNTPLSVAVVTETVWGKDSVKDNAIWSSISKLNSRFLNANVPIVVFYQKGHVHYLINRND